MPPAWNIQKQMYTHGDKKMSDIDEVLDYYLGAGGDKEMGDSAEQELVVFHAAAEALERLLLKYNARMLSAADWYHAAQVVKAIYKMQGRQEE